MKSVLIVGIMFVAILIMPFANAQQFEKMAFQESATIIYDQKLSESIITSIGFETISNEDIRFSDELIEKINSNEKIKAVVFTNAGECVIGVTTEQQCIMINFNYEQLRGDGGIRIVQESAREMAELLIDDLNDVFRTDAEFHSIFIHTRDDTNSILQTSGVISGTGAVSATYVTDKKSTDFLFTDLAGILIPKTIRDGGGFFEVSEKLSKNDDSIISISIIPNGNSNIYLFKVTIAIEEENMDVKVLNPLDTLGISEISRTKYFENKNVPLNSVIQLIVIPKEITKVNAISTHAITDMTKIENVMKKGWFLSSPAGDMIDLRFLFGTDNTVLANELLVETAPWDMQEEMTLYSVEDIKNEATEINEENRSNDEDGQAQYVILGIIIVAGIGAAIFYLKGYKPKR
jgi:hypothetical protein